MVVITKDIYLLVFNNSLQIVWGINDGKGSPATLAHSFQTTNYMVAACDYGTAGYTNMITSKTISQIYHTRYNGTSSNSDIMYICIGY